MAKIDKGIENRKEMEKKMMEKMDLRTQAEKAREMLHDRIRNDYRDAIRTQPSVRPYRVMTVLGVKYGWTTQGIASLLRRTGDYAPKRMAVK